jgi:hypothetical protein
MNTLRAAMLLVAALTAGCSGVGNGAPASMSERQVCEGQRGGGVWVAAAGACIRGGAGM